MGNSSLHVDQHFCHALVLASVTFKLLRCLRWNPETIWAPMKAGSCNKSGAFQRRRCCCKPIVEPALHICYQHSSVSRPPPSKLLDAPLTSEANIPTTFVGCTFKASAKVISANRKLQDTSLSCRWPAIVSMWPCLVCFPS